MDEISTIPLVDILSKQLDEQVVMSEDDYVFMSNKNIVPQSEVDIALTEQVALKDKEIEIALKQAKLLALSNLTVTTTNGNTFDADDIARADMQSAITASDTLSITEHTWKLADNSWVIIQLAELKEAQALAIQAKGVILAS